MTNRPIHRLAVLDRGYGALRIVRTARHLARELGIELETVALHGEADARAAFVRDADEARRVAGLTTGESANARAVDAIAGAVAASDVDAVWTGWGPWSGDAAVARSLEGTGARRLGLPVSGLGRAGPEHACAEVTVLVDDDGATWAFEPRGVVFAAGRPVVYVSRTALLAPDDARAAREIAERAVTELGLRGGAATVAFALPPTTVDLEGAATGGDELEAVGAAAAGVDVTRLPTSITASVGAGHPATEAVIHLDLVELELRLALGQPLPRDPPTEVGVAVTALVRAEDPERDWTPTTGRVELLRTPLGPELRVDPVVVQGDALRADTDPTLLVLTASGADRTEAIARMRSALEATALVVTGGTTDVPFLMRLLDRTGPRSPTRPIPLGGRSGDDRGEDGPGDDLDVALVLAAVESYEVDTAVDRAAFFASAARGRPRVGLGGGRNLELRWDGHDHALRVSRLDRERYRITSGDVTVDADVERLGRFERRVAVGGDLHRAIVVPDEGGIAVELDGRRRRFVREEGGVVRAPVPGVVVATPVKPGDDVTAGDRVIVLESMKTELSLGAPLTGKIKRVLVSTNVQVGAGTPLLHVGTDHDGDPLSGRERPISLERLAGPPGGRLPADRDHRTFERIERVLLGYDVDAAEAREAAAAWIALCHERPADDPELRAGEDDVLRLFANLASLLRPQRISEGPEAEIAHSAQEDLFVYLGTLDATDAALPPTFVPSLRAALADHGIGTLDRTPELEEALFRIARALERLGDLTGPVAAILDRRLEHIDDIAAGDDDGLRGVLDRIVGSTQHRFPAVADLAREVRYRSFDSPLFERARAEVYGRAWDDLAALDPPSSPEERARRIDALVACPQPLKPLLAGRFPDASEDLRAAMLEVLTRRYYRIRDLVGVRTFERDGRTFATATYPHDGTRIAVLTTFALAEDLAAASAAVAARVADLPADHDVAIDLYVWRSGPAGDPDTTAGELAALLDACGFPRPIRRIVIAASGPGRGLGMAATEHFTFRPTPDGYREERVSRGLHPMMGKRLELWRLSNFEIERLPSVEDMYLFHAVAHENPKDERLFALAEVRDLTPTVAPGRGVVGLPHLERMLVEAFAAIRVYQSHRSPKKRLVWNRVLLYLWPPFELSTEELFTIVHGLSPMAEGLGLEKVVVRCWTPEPTTGQLVERVIHIANPDGAGLTFTFDYPTDTPIQPLSEYMQKVVVNRQRGLHYPYETIQMLTPPPGSTSDLPSGDFVEHDLDDRGRLVPVQRPPGENRANIVAGVIRSFTPAYPEGIARVILLGDPSRALGSLAEAECRRIIAGLDLAEEMGVPLEWFALSAGARIAMDTGTETMDWIARVLRRLIEFTQAGGEVNVVVAGINVGAQPYWNAEATMLMHTRGILVMTPESAMVLTGKQALDYSGGVSAEDNFGIGGFERVMGPNGQAQYWAPDLHAASQVLLRHYAYAYVSPGERFPRRLPTVDPVDRDVRTAPHRDLGERSFTTVGQIFSDETNPGRKHPFDMRSVMRAVVDADHVPLERWPMMRDAEMAIVWDACVGGIPACLIGIESRPLTRHGSIPADGPDQWTSGTLFPMSSKKIARAVNGASGDRPLVVLANLTGFDGSPDSLRNIQLEYGAEIGRAITNFRGPIVFVVVSRYHGGAFVVFSAPLNDSIEVAAVEGSYASVIGGAPAAAVVFTRDVDARTDADPRVAALRDEVAAASGADQVRLRARFDELRREVRTEKLGDTAEEFDRVHTIYRAQEVGSVHRIIPAERLRPYLVDALERGIERELHGAGAGARA